MSKLLDSYVKNKSPAEAEEVIRRVNDQMTGSISEQAAIQLVLAEMRDEKKADGGRMGYGAGGIIAGWVAKQIAKKTAKPVTQKSIDFSSDAIVKRLDNYNIKPNDIVSEDQLLKVLDSVKQAENNVFNNKFGNIMEQGMEGITKLKKADGGRIGYYGGGMTNMVEPDLSDIGHGTDSLNARTRVMSPGSQATTSTGLNYLLGEDNDNTRVPFNKGTMVLPKAKPKESGGKKTLDLLAKNKKASQKTLGSKTLFNLMGQSAAEAYKKGEISKSQYDSMMKPFFGEPSERLSKTIDQEQSELRADGGRMGYGVGSRVMDFFTPKGKGAKGIMGTELGHDGIMEIISLLSSSGLFADGGRAGYDEGGDVKLSDMFKINMTGTKSGKQQIQGAPEGITSDKEMYQGIMELDVPLKFKVNLLGEYAFGKSRNKIEKDGEELFLQDPASFGEKKIGLGFNQGGDGVSGYVKKNIDTGEDEGRIDYKKAVNLNKIFDKMFN